MTDDAWRLDEWRDLPDECLIAGCDDAETCQRGPIWLRDGTMHKACVEHWDAIIGVLGRQATRDHGWWNDRASSIHASAPFGDQDAP